MSEASTWGRIEELFDRLVDRPDSEWSRLLSAECDDPELREEVLALLRADRVGARVEAVVERAFLAAGELMRDEPGPLGPWRLVREIGRGGMGTVHLAERDDDSYRGRAAIKLLRWTRSPEASARFSAERRILSGLSHPNIARLLDGGESETGRPYLVMEYVEGKPLDDFCEERGLTAPERIRLFRDVCSAVQYAHGRLVVHRDLKPENILVDLQGTPRLLDFGIAKLLEDDEGVRTRTGRRLMSPPYASPEQIRGERMGTATDVYSLGVVLYELLTGRHPHPVDDLSPREMEDAILEHDPPPPSESMRARGPRGTTTRRSDVHWRDLDTIIQKAMAKEPERRYPSAEALSEDLSRLLDGLPVRARPDTRRYRLARFLRRNRAAVSAGAAAAATVVTFALGSAVQARELARERDEAETARAEAEAVQSFLVDVFEATDPNEAQGLDVTALEILTAAEARVRDELAGRPGLQSAVMTALGRANTRLGEHDQAVALLTESVERAREAHGLRSLGVATPLRFLGQAQRAAGDAPAAEETYRRVLEIRAEALGTEALETGEAWNNLGNVLGDLGRYEEAEAALLEALRIRRIHLDTADEQVVTTLGNLGSVYIDMGRHDEAIEYTGQALEGERQIHGGELHLDVAMAANNHGSALQYGGRLGDAEPLYRESLTIRQALLPEGHPSVLVLKNNLANFLGSTGQPEEAVRLLASILPERRRRGEDIPLAVVLNNYGTNLHRTGRHAEAVDALGESYDLMRGVWGDSHPNLAYPRLGMAQALAVLGRDAEAEAAFLEAAELRREALGEDHELYRDVAEAFAEFLRARGRR